MRIVFDENVIEFTDAESGKAYMVNARSGGRYFEMNERNRHIIDFVRQGKDNEYIIKELCGIMDDAKSKRIRKELEELMEKALYRKLCVLKD